MVGRGGIQNANCSIYTQQTNQNAGKQPIEPKTACDCCGRASAQKRDRRPIGHCRTADASALPQGARGPRASQRALVSYHQPDIRQQVEGFSITKEIANRPQSVSAFVSKARALKRVADAQNRLIFALDATASREPTWHVARTMHQALFDVATEDATFALQLCYFRGLMQFEATPWMSKPGPLLDALNAVYCQGGATQIELVLRHALGEFEGSSSIKAIVYIGDACEENPDTLNALAVQCRLAKRPLLLFQEGSDATASRCFASMAALSGGAHVQLDDASRDRLRELLKSAVRFVLGGRKALQGSRRESDKLLLNKLSS